MRFEMLSPGHWVLLASIPFVIYFALRTHAQASRSRRILMALLRSAIVVCIAAALVQIRVWRKAEETRLCVLALVDVSESIPERAAAAIASEIAACSAKANDDLLFGLILFAGQSDVAIAPSPKPIAREDVEKTIRAILTARRGTPEYQRLRRQETSIDGALELAEATFPEGFGRRIVLWSDGNETAGHAIERAATLARANIDVFARPVDSREDAFDILTAGITVPTQIRLHEAFDVRVQVMSTKAIRGRMLLYRNGFLSGQKEVSFNDGSTEVVFRQSLPESGQ